MHIAQVRLINLHYHGFLFQYIFLVLHLESINFDEEYNTKHYEEQLFTGYDICEFEKLFEQYKTKYLTTVALDNILELAEERKDFGLSDSNFELFCKYHLATCEKRELLGSSSHLLYICKKL